MHSEIGTTCKIQWITDEGKPTPDNNAAVMIAHSHEAIWSMASGGLGNRIIGYSDKISASYPICAAHYARVTPDMLQPYGAWSFTTLDTEGVSVT